MYDISQNTVIFNISHMCEDCDYLLNVSHVLFPSPYNTIFFAPLLILILITQNLIEFGVNLCYIFVSCQPYIIMYYYVYVHVYAEYYVYMYI